MLLEIMRARNEALLARIERALDRAAAGSPDLTDAQAVAIMLEQVDGTEATAVLRWLAARDGGLAQEVERRMTRFEDIELLDDRSVQVLLRELDAPLLARALEGASPATRSSVFRNMSRRASEQLEADMQAMEPVPMAEVRDAQSAVADILRGLVARGAIAPSRGG